MKGMKAMTQDTQAHQDLYTLQELHKIKPKAEGYSKDGLIYVSCANYARIAMLANLSAVLENKSERLYKKTDDEMIAEAKIFYKDYKDALNRALMLR